MGLYRISTGFYGFLWLSLDEHDHPVEGELGFCLGMAHECSISMGKKLIVDR